MMRKQCVLFKKLLFHQSRTTIQPLGFKKYSFQPKFKPRFSATSNFSYDDAASADSDSRRSAHDFLSNYDFDAPTIDWKRLKSDFIASSYVVRDYSADAVIIQHLTGKKLWAHARRFVEHAGELNLGATGQLLALYHEMGNDGALTEGDVERILRIYARLRSEYKTLDAGTRANLGCALSHTPEWRDCARILDEIRKCDTPGSRAYSSLVRAAFAHDDADLGWECLRATVLDRRNPAKYAYTAWFEYCARKWGRNKAEMLENVERLIAFTADNQLLLTPEPAKKLVEIFREKLGWSGEFVRMPRSGKCPNCDRHLDPTQITDKEFHALKDEFYDKVIVGRNIFSKSSPEEVKKFMEFLKATAPFDVVIDGLNVSHSSNIKSSRKLAENLVIVVKRMLECNEKILVLGKRHMTTWPKQDLLFLKKNSYLFLTEDSSYDDLFILYAALSSPNTNFISRDLMRGHKFLLQDEKLQTTFKKWQQSHQYMIERFTNNGKVIIKDPIARCVVAHKNVGWHIPYNVTEHVMLADTLDIPENWICLMPQEKPKRKYNKKK